LPCWRLVTNGKDYEISPRTSEPQLKLRTKTGGK
jgi:hypothetical protein